MPTDPLTIISTVVSGVLIPLMLVLISSIKKLTTSGVNFIDNLDKNYASMRTDITINRGNIEKIKDSIDEIVRNCVVQQKTIITKTGRQT